LDAAQPLHINNTTVTAFDVYHGPVRCLAYKIQHGPASFLFCTDHELRHGAQPADPRQAESAMRDASLVEHCRGVDVAYFDGQYFRAEYDGNRGIGSTMAVSRVDWGHGCVEDIPTPSAPGSAAWKSTDGCVNNAMASPLRWNSPRAKM
jgi:hypothetical protein